MKKRRLAFLFLLLLGIISLAVACSRGSRSSNHDGFHSGDISFLDSGMQLTSSPLATPAPAMSMPTPDDFFVQTARRESFSVPESAVAYGATWGGSWDGDIAFRSFETTQNIALVGDTTAGVVEWEDIAGQNERHIIQTARVEMETDYFDNVVEALRKIAPSVNGYVQSEQLTTHGRRIFSIVLRVPVANFEEVLQDVEGLADVNFSNQWAEDVTHLFYDTIGHLQTRLIEEERILALIENAELVQDLITLEMRLRNTRVQIETYQNRLTDLAGQIAFSTINVMLSEIQEQEIITLSLGQRISNAMGDSISSASDTSQDVVIFVAGLIVPAILFAIAGSVVFLLARRAIRRRKP